MQLMEPPPPPPPPLPPSPSHPRRPRVRVREVSSRFMSPLVQRAPPRHHQQPEVDENHPPPPPSSSSETPFPSSKSTTSTLHNRKQRPNPHPPTSKSCSGRLGNGFTSPSFRRPDTPTLTLASRYNNRLTPPSINASASASASAAAKLLQATATATSSSNSPQRQPNSLSLFADTSSVCSHDEDHTNSSSEVNCSVQSLPEFRSSASLDAVTSSGHTLKFPTTPFSRSLNISLSGSDSTRGSEKHVTSLVKQFTHPPRAGGLCLPPVAPPCPKPGTGTGTDPRKGRKGSTHHEDVHTFRLLYNRYLQWRYANAKAQSSMKAHQTESEKALYSLALKMSELRDSVNLKRIQVQLLQRAKTLLTILEVQIPYLDEWSTLEEGYSASLTEATGALLNASAQLPVGGNVVKVDAMEVGEAINSSLKMMESIVFHVQKFIPKVEGMDITISELAGVVGGERAFIGECGSLLARAQKSQVEEYSLRSQLMQLHSISHKSNEAN